VPRPGALRASVGSTEASKSLLARVGVVGPQRLQRHVDGQQGIRVGDCHPIVHARVEPPPTAAPLGGPFSSRVIAEDPSHRLGHRPEELTAIGRGHRG
jgi:hypothetical protein